MTHLRGLWLPYCCLTWCVLLFPALAQESAPEKSQEESATKDAEAVDAPEIYTVKSAPFRVEIELNGLLEARQTAEVVLTPKTWSTFSVERAVSHGTTVKKGQPIIWLETEQIDEKIRSVQHDIELAKISRQTTEAELETLAKSLPLDMKAAANAKAVADDALRFHDKIGKQQSIDDAEYSLKSAQFQLEYAEEELKQLQEMYEADDLTEETEEIILKRAQRAVEQQQRYLDRAKVRTQRQLSTYIPREEKAVNEAADRAALTYANKQITLPAALKKKRLEMQKLLREHQELDEQLTKLQEDRKAMVIRAPRDGVVYYGRCERGKWLDKSKVDAQLRPGGTLATDQVVLSVVALRPLAVRAALPETDLGRVSTGAVVEVTPSALPDIVASGKVAEIGLIPLTEGSFDCVIRVSDKQLPELIVPGMKCTATVVLCDKSQAITIPESALQTDSKGREYVERIGDDGKQQRRNVKTGMRGNDQVEILDGLEAGDQVVKEPA